MRRVLAALLAAPVLMAGTLTNEEAAEKFGARETLTNVELSPDGRTLIYLGATSGRQTAAFIVPLETMTAIPVMTSSGDPDRLRWCDFAGVRRIVCSFSIYAESEGIPYGASRLLAADLDGRNVKPLGQKRSAYDERVRQVDGYVLDFLPQEDGAVLIARDYVPEAGKIGTLVVRTADGLGVDRIDTTTLKSQRVESPQRTAIEYISDGQGHVRLMALGSSRGATGRDGAGVIYRYRPADGSGWQDFGRYNFLTGEGVQPIAIDAERNAAYALKKLNGRQALYRIALALGLAEELVYANAEVDVDGIVRSGTGRRVIGVTFADDRRRAIYFDQEAEGLIDQLSAALPTLPLLDIVGSDAAGTKLILHASSDDDPGRYYLFDRATKRLGLLGSARPKLEGVALSKVASIHYPATDGTPIPGYLTLPPGATDARGLPGIVLPHGGPSARDEWGFDWLPQFLANRGYAVLQPNYRGSAGYGDAWFEQNGFQSWEIAIGDVTAGGRWLVSQGVPADRLGIVGWSYGGYAALQSAATGPDIFKAVVAIAPVTDLQLLKDDARNYTSAANVNDVLGTGPHIAAGSPLRNVNTIAAPVLLVHGTHDLAVDVEQSRKMAAALRRSGKTVDYLEFPDLGHQLADSTARAEMLTRMAHFLDTRLK